MDAASEKRKVTRAAGVVGLATLASRVGGYLRDRVIAQFFGAGMESDAFFVAFRIPNLLRRLFAEGTLTIAFIPVFTEVLKLKGERQAFLLARAAMSMLVLALVAACGLGMFFAEDLVRAIAWGWNPSGQAFTLAVRLTRWCLPFLLVVSLLALAAGVLNSLGHFFAPAAAPLVLNLSIIAAALCLRGSLEPAVLSLAVGVVAGGVLQLILQVPFLRAKGVPLRPAWRPHDPMLRKVLRLMGPAAFGAAVYQLTVFLDTVLASYLPRGTVSYLWYADRLMQFPLGIFAIALSTAILPSLSRQAADGDLEALKDTMGYGVRLTWFIALPAMVGLVVLAEPLMTLLFKGGRFGLEASHQAALALMGYGAGLWAVAGVRPVLQSFYALKDTKTPVLVAAGALLVKLGVSLWLMGPLRQMGLTLGTSAGAVFNLLVLMVLLRRRLGPLGGRRMALSGLKALGLSLFMGGAAWLVAFGPDWGDRQGLAAWVLRPVAAMTAGMALYLLLARLARLPELAEVLEVLRHRR